MSELICSCGDPRLGNMGRPSCVLEAKTMAFPIFVPRYKEDGVTRNTIDLTSATLGADIQALIQASANGYERMYPFPKVENVTFERTDTAYETAPSEKKFKLDGVGGVRTVAMELWGKDANYVMLRELKNYGCADVDMFIVDIAGNIWGIKDDINDTVLRGYAVQTETFDSFKVWATDTTVNKINVSFDLDSECEENSYAIEKSELGYSATSLRGLQTGYSSNTEPTNGNVVTDLFTAYGSAGNRAEVIGVTAPTLTLYNVTTATAMTAPTGWAAVAGVDGQYTFAYTDAESTTGDVLRLSIVGVNGYDFADSTFTAL